MLAASHKIIKAYNVLSRLLRSVRLALHSSVDFLKVFNATAIISFFTEVSFYALSQSRSRDHGCAFTAHSWLAGR